MLSSLPSSPGVYWFLDSEDNVLYVGKAKNLKNRVRSYTQIKQLSHRIKQLVVTAEQLKFETLESELEALLVEAELIRTYQPHFNDLLKDDKSPLYIQITDELFPRVKKVRKKEILTKKITGTVLGPFQSAYKVTEVLKIARRIFPWCDKNKTGDQTKNIVPCFYYHLDLCPGACVHQISVAQYQETISQLILFLRGKKKAVLQNLKTQMQEAVAQEAFEEAAKLRDQIRVITEVTTKKYRLKPNLVLPTLQLSKTQNGLVYLQKLLSTYSYVPKKYPLERIEGYDVSNTQGTNPAVAMVTFIDGQADTSKYRVFNIKSLTTPNDYHMMKEAIIRRQNHPEWGRPNLVIVDGGKGQIRAALSIWQWDIPIIGIAKNPDRIIIPILDPKNKQSLSSLKYHIEKLQGSHPTLQLAQQVRDEAHRFSQKQHKKLRAKTALSHTL